MIYSHPCALSADQKQTLTQGQNSYDKTAPITAREKKRKRILMTRHQKQANKNG